MTNTTSDAQSDPMLPLGRNYCQCGDCGRYFKSVFAFDKHLIGTGSNTEPRCLTDAEMRDKGMVKNAKGYWVGQAWEGPFAPAQAEMELTA